MYVMRAPATDVHILYARWRESRSLETKHLCMHEIGSRVCSGYNVVYVKRKF